jgi:hypothetical protein
VAAPKEQTTSENEKDDLSPTGRRGFTVALWVWIPALMTLGLVIWLLVEYA